MYGAARRFILKGRDPRDTACWAHLRRLHRYTRSDLNPCAKMRRIAIPDNANCIRNMMQATLHVAMLVRFIICARAGLG